MVGDQNAGTSTATNNTSNATGATDANKNTGTSGSESQVDTSTWTEKDWEKVYSDPKLYNHPRFKGLNERANKASEYEKQQVEAEKQRLADEKKYQELADLNKKEAETWKSKAETASINNSIAMEAQKLGVVDTEAVTKLIERSGIKLAEDGTISGVAEAVKSLVESKPYLIGKGDNKNLSIGSGTAPNNGANASTPRFKLSQLQDHAFFVKNEKDIMKAFSLNLVENDTNQRA